MTEPGVRQPIYLDGYTFSYDPVSLTPTPTFGESIRRARDGTLLPHTHRASILNPDSSSKFSFELAWEDLSAADVVVWNRCVAKRGPFLFCPWMMWSESFSFLDGENVAGKFQRGSAKDEIPSALAPGTPATDYDVTFELNGVASSAFSVGAMVSYRTPWTSDPLLAVASVVEGFYAPLFKVRMAAQTPLLYSARQGSRMILEEY